jgi:nucleoside-diphosphate-sugar epimerase
LAGGTGSLEARWVVLTLEKSSVKRVLVTGASGFIGRALLSLRSPAYEYIAASRTQFDFEGGGWRRSPDLSPSADWRDALNGVDSVVHLAGRVHLPKEGDPSRFFFDNHQGTVKLVEDAVQAGVSQFVYLSTAKVLGDETDISGLTESAKPCPADPYSASKLAAEQALHRFSDRLGITILRPPLVYGPGVKANFLALLSAVSRGIPLPLKSVRNRRSLIGVVNLAQAIVACLESPRSAGHTFHVTDGSPISTPQLVREIAAAFDKPARLFAFPPSLLEACARAIGREETMKRLTRSLELDDSAIRSEIGWQPTNDLATGINETVSWYGTQDVKPV